MSDFWGGLIKEFHTKYSSSVDDYVSNSGRSVEGSYFNSIYSLTDRGREENSIQLPVEAGTRVSFVSNVGSILTYENPPSAGSEGTVIMVRTADGDTTYFNDHVFVKWDNGKFGTIHKHHLRNAGLNTKIASSVSIRVSNLGDLTGFFEPVGGGKKDLIHKATKDLWSLQKNGDQFVLNRLFEDDGNPLKLG